MSLHLSNEENARLTIVNYPTGYILKPQTKDYEYLPEYEDLAMRLAAIAGIQVVPHALLKIGDTFAYITKRIDRHISGDRVSMYAMEDFCQLSNRMTYDKYRGSYEGCGRIVKKYSEYPGIDMSELFLRVLFSYVIGNSDMHLKNLSLQQTSSGDYIMTPAYDLLNTSLHINDGDFALHDGLMPKDVHSDIYTQTGHPCRDDFAEFGRRIGVLPKKIDAIIEMFAMEQPMVYELIERSFLDDRTKRMYKRSYEERLRRFQRTSK